MHKRLRPDTTLLATGTALAALLLLAGFGPAAATSADPAASGQAEGVSALGRIEPEHGVIHVGGPSTMNAANGSVVRKLLVEAGDDVKAGQLLAETDTAAVEEAEVAVRQAELKLAEHESEQAGGEEQDVCSRSEVAQRTATRQNNLLKRGVTSDEEADVASGNAKALQGSCSAARIATKAAAARVDVARAKLARAQADAQRCYLRAPMDGRVLRILKRPGELLGVDGLLKMGAVGRMYAIAEIYETDVRRVRTGQKATITSGALEGQLSGVVEHVRLEVRKQDATGTDPAARKDARIVEVEVLLDQPERVAGLTNLQVEVVIHP